MLRSASEPIIQNTISCSAKALRDQFITSAISALQSEEIATPARISVVVSWLRCASSSTSSTASAVPAMPASGSASAAICARPV